jgi:hypothetical protein
MHLMKRRRNTDPLPQPPTDQELEAYENESEGAIGPTKHDFTIHYLGPPLADPWNSQCVYIFVKYFRNSAWKNVCTDKSRIKTFFVSHMDTLRRTYKKTVGFGKDPMAQAAALSKNARDTRRLNVRYSHHGPTYEMFKASSDLLSTPDDYEVIF